MSECATTTLPMDETTLKNEYTTLVRTRDTELVKHDRLLDSYMRLKDYSTELRLAVANIPTESKKSKSNQALKKAKRIANRDPSLYHNNEKVRKSETSGADSSVKTKRPYTKRKQADSGAAAVTAKGTSNKRRKMSKTSGTTLRKNKQHGKLAMEADDILHSDASASSSSSEGGSRDSFVTEHSDPSISRDEQDGQDMNLNILDHTVPDAAPIFSLDDTF